MGDRATCLERAAGRKPRPADARRGAAVSGGGLSPGRRPTYFEGRLLTADELAAEQDYHLSRRRLVNRAVLGDGVVAGLGVKPAGTPGGPLVVGPGMAVDAWGREIVVPDDVEVAVPGPGEYTLEVRYREELVGRTPGGDATTVVEGYEVGLREGAAPDAAPSVPPEVVEALWAGDVQAALCRLAAAAGETGDGDRGEDPAVVLANVTADRDGGVTVDACRPRRVALTNRLLAQLVAALAVPDQAGA